MNPAVIPRLATACALAAVLAPSATAGPDPEPQLFPLPTFASWVDANSTGSAGAIVFTNLTFHVPTTGAGTGGAVLVAAAARYRAIILQDRRTRRPHGSTSIDYPVAFRIGDLAVPLSPGTTDESYAIAADAAGATITAPTQWGALKALETFSQLVHARGGGVHSLPAPPIKVTDRARFGYRGLMIDTSRSYLTVTAIKQALDAMAYSKLNLLHWHMVDDQSFPVESTALPNLAGLGAYSPAHTYSHADLAEVVAYARARGIAVLPEFDIPGHTSSWQIGYPDLSSQCANLPPAAHPLDPTRESTYALIKTLLAEIDPLFGDEFPFWHMGGDEVAYACWQNSTGGYIDAYMAASGIAKGGYAALQAHFEQRVVDIVRALPSKKRTVLWEDESTSHTSGLPLDAVVELWRESNGNATVVDATVKAGRRIIYTTPDW